jgi:hypothetical protein
MEDLSVGTEEMKDLPVSAKTKKEMKDLPAVTKEMKDLQVLRDEGSPDVKIWRISQQAHEETKDLLASAKNQRRDEGSPSRCEKRRRIYQWALKPKKRWRNSEWQEVSRQDPKKTKSFQHRRHRTAVARKGTAPKNSQELPARHVRNWGGQKRRSKKNTNAS